MSDQNATEILERTPLRTLMSIPSPLLDQAMGLAYQAYTAGQLAEAETLCKGLLAADHRYWWAYSLHAAILRKLGRFAEALTALERGLKYEPGQPKLLQMRRELLEVARRVRARRAHASSAGAASAQTGAV